MEITYYNASARAFTCNIDNKCQNKESEKDRKWKLPIKNTSVA
jgi:hypothetical protein